VASVLKKRIRQFKALMFVGVRIENHPRVRAETFDLRDVVHAKSTAFIEPAGVGKDVPAAGFVDMELDPLLANGTLRANGMRSPPPQHLDEFHKPYR
jgi:hypothetical protein